ncbi:MAG: hypothetical protein M3144_02150 [Actinomycetota bacterium]|nr:hypothetical protein [Actinomycetota bacterium]
MPTPDKTNMLEMVAEASEAYEAARQTLQKAVHTALDHGASWSAIGGVLGVSRQAAFQRFGRKRTSASRSDDERAMEARVDGLGAANPSPASAPSSGAQPNS